MTGQPVSVGALESVVGTVLDGTLSDLLPQRAIDALAHEVAERLLEEFAVTREVRA